MGVKPSTVPSMLMVNVPPTTSSGDSSPALARATVDERVDDFAHVGARPSALLGGRKHGFDDAPLRVREVGVVRFSFYIDTIIASFRILDTAY